MNPESRYQPPTAEVADAPEDEVPLGRLNPWFSMWLRPRATIQQIVDSNPDHVVVPMSILIGIVEVLDQASSRSMGDRMSLWEILATAIVVGPVSGVLGVYILAWLIRWTGRFIDGNAEPPAIRAALVWGNVPALWTSLSWIPALLVLRLEMFTTETPIVDSNTLHLLVLLGVGVAQLVGAAWSTVTACKALGQVQGFSAWKALGNAAMAVLVVLGPIMVVAALIAAF